MMRRNFWHGRFGVRYHNGGIMLRHRDTILGIGHITEGIIGIDLRRSTFADPGFTLGIKIKPVWCRWGD